MDLAGRCAVVTGAGRGLGRAIASELAAAGADTVLVSRTQTELDETAGLIAANGAGGQVMARAVDITVEDEIRALHSAVSESFGTVDILVNNAGNILYQSLVPLPGNKRHGDAFAEPMEKDAFEGVFGTHVVGAFLMCREFGPEMIENGYGRVINICSNVIERIVPFNLAYDVAKAGLAQFTKSLAVEWARHNVAVNGIAAGHFRTQMSEAQFANSDAYAKMLRRVPMRRAGEHGEIAALTAFLASDKCGFLTGEIICLDGGETL